MIVLDSLAYFNESINKISSFLSMSIILNSIKDDRDNLGRYTSLLKSFYISIHTANYRI